MPTFFLAQRGEPPGRPGATASRQAPQQVGMTNWIEINIWWKQMENCKNRSKRDTSRDILRFFFSFFFIIFCTSMVGNRWLYQMIPTCDGWPCQAKTLPVVMDAQRNSLVSSLGCVWKCGASNGYSNFKHGDKPYYTLPNFWDPVENFLNFWQTSILWVIYFCQHLLSISCTENLQAGLHWLQVLARSQNMTCCCCCCCCCCCQKIARHVSWGCSAGVPSLQSETNWAPCRLRNPICQPRQLLLVLAPCLEVGGFENTVTVAGRTFGLSRGWVFEDFGAEHDLSQDCHINPSREPTWQKIHWPIPAPWPNPLFLRFQVVQARGLFAHKQPRQQAFSCFRICRTGTFPYTGHQWFSRIYIYMYI